ncbi:energy transducer TonB [Arenimonas fontis]|uniref:TonB family protein n=1 Tax=Arenimonas fontis TaxID=2608255 RepID=A0A5B2Z771_9GAMM|nr:TonB family protein [Arenimonas fontis]KAA2284618.1 TonB family protein [Arenimonas fontis]
MRDAAARALAEQRFYAPAGDNAIEHYLALVALRPDDAALDTTLLELLPYAVIAAEQAIERAEFAEARRLIGLVARVDEGTPAVTRLQHALLSAEAAEAARLQAETEAAARQRGQLATGERTAGDADGRATAPATADLPATAPGTAPQGSGPTEVAGGPPSSPPATALGGAWSARPNAGDATSPVPSPAPLSASPAPLSASPARPVLPSPAPPPGAPKVTPRLASAPIPRYPLMALRRRIEGEVTVAFVVRADGSVEAPRVLSAQPEGVFEEAALEAVRRWRFEPLPGPVEQRQVLQFRLPTQKG